MRCKQKRTKGGLTYRDLWYSYNTGKVVSTLKSAQMKERYPGSKLAAWNRCVSEARNILGFQGRFVPVKGKTDEGLRLWATAKALLRLHG